MNPTKYLKGECQQCSGHLEFPADAVSATVECPHCGEQTELLLATPTEDTSVQRRTIVWVAVAITILVLGLAGALVALKRAERWAAKRKAQMNEQSANGETNSATPAAAAPSGSDGQGDLQVSDIALEKDTGSSLVYAVGTLTNSLEKQRFGVRVELDLLDSAGQKVGTAKDYQQVLEPRGQWHFKALVMDSRATSAKVSSITEEK